jgi:beta-glucanase (GH16 family)
MRSSILSAAGLVLAAGMASAQTFTDCNPTEKSCPCDDALGKTITTDFTKGKSDDWVLEDGTSMTYSGSDGAQFTIAKGTDAPTIKSSKYIFFGKVSVTMKASPGTGTVSSFILESDDLDEIDWEWLGSTDSSVESNFFGKGNTTTYDRAIYHPVSTPIETYHEYTIDWTSEYVKWYIDGALTRTLLYTDALALGGKNFPQTPMMVKMGNWIGCADAKAAADPKTKGTCDWAGGYVDLTKGPYVMNVKSVTVQDYGSGSQYCYSDLTGSFQSITSTGGSSKDTSSSKSSSAGSSTASAKSSSSTKSGSSSTTSAPSSSSTSGSSSSSASDSTDTSATTLTTTASAATGSKTVAAAATTASSTAAAKASSSGAETLKPKHKYGAIDGAVMILGLFLGYLVM